MEIEDYLGTNSAIVCETKEEYVKILKLITESSLKDGEVLHRNDKTVINEAINYIKGYNTFLLEPGFACEVKEEAIKDMGIKVFQAKEFL